MSDQRVPAAVRRAVEAQARGLCEYCRSPAKYSPQSFSVEHILPRSQGGKPVPENLALSCQGCNNHKYAKTAGIDPISGSSVPLFHPRQHQWRQHFTWNEDSSRVIGLTPIGRATVEALQLNREGLVNLRQLLFAVGQHPQEEH
jgi:hypothetical protein